MRGLLAAAPAGPARAEFERLLTRFAVGLRVGGAVAGGIGAVLGLAAPASPALVGVAVAGLLGWAACYAVLALRHGWTRWLVAGDIVGAAVLCLGYGRLVPAAALPGRSTWLTVVASSAVIISQLSPWLVLGIAGTVAVPAAYAAGSVLSGQTAPALAGLFVAQGTATAVLMRMLRRHAQAADTAIAEQETLQREAAVRASRRAEEREHCRLLHDSASATLTVVAAGVVADSPTLRAQASRDLDVIERIQAPAAEPAGPAGQPDGPGEPGGQPGGPAGQPGGPGGQPGGLGSQPGGPDGSGGPGGQPGGPGGGPGGERAGAAGELGGDGATGQGRGDLRSWLAPVVSAQPALAVDMAVADVAVPAAVGTAVAAAVAEALRNVVRHAGAAKVSLRAWPAHGVVRIELTDDGSGFDPAQVPAHRRGLRESVVARMSRVGGSAAIASRPGAGTRVVLQWPAAPGQPTAGAGSRPAGTDTPDRPAPVVPPGPAGGDPAQGAAGEAAGDDAGDSGFGDLVATRYQRGFELVVVSILAIRHLANALLVIVTHQWAYRSFGAELVAWALMFGVGAVGAVRLLRHRTGAVASWLLAAAVLALSALATGAVAEGRELTTAHWALGATCWFGVIVLLRRPIAELAVLIAANAGLTLVMLLHDGPLDRVSVARLLMEAYGLAALPIGLALVVRALDGTARRAAAAAETQAALRRRAQVAEALHRGRLDRYRTVRRSVVPLLVGLASGELDPADRGIQRRCAVEGSRLRRLFAETDDVPDPLLHELRACADIAYSRGVLVDLQVIGRLPTLSRPVRRALTEAPLHALAGARRQARVTVFGRSTEVAVSVLTDAGGGEPAELPAPLDHARTVTVRESVVPQDGENRRWIEARWQG